MQRAKNIGADTLSTRPSGIGNRTGTDNSSDVPNWSRVTVIFGIATALSKWCCWNCLWLCSPRWRFAVRVRSIW